MPIDSFKGQRSDLNVKCEVEPPIRKLNHELSNLPDASQSRGSLNFDELVRRTQLGDFGSTEVPSSQVW